MLNTVWKFQDFCITENLREINFEDSRSAKSTISIHLEALNFGFYDFLHFLKAGIFQKSKFRAPKNSKLVDLQSLESSKLISRKI